MERSEKINAAVKRRAPYPLLKYSLWLILAAWVYTLTFIFNNYWSKYASYKSVTASFQKAIIQKETAFGLFSKDTITIKKIVTGKNSLGGFSAVQKVPFELFIYKRLTADALPVYWSSANVLPDLKDLGRLPSGSFVQYGGRQYELLKRQVDVNKTSFFLIGLILLHEDLTVENSGLKGRFPGFEGLEGKMKLISEPSSYQIKGENNAILCWLKPLVPEPIYIFNLPSFLVECLVAFLIGLFITRVATALMRRGKNGFRSLAFFLAGLLLLRFCILRLNLPLNLDMVALNNGIDNRKLMRLLINLIFSFWGAFFINANRKVFLQWIEPKTRPAIAFTAVLFAATLVGFHFLTIIITRMLYLNDSVSINLTNFFRFDFIAIFSFFILFLISYTHFLVSEVLIRSLLKVTGNKPSKGALLITLSGLAALFALTGKNYSTTLFFSLIGLVLFFYLLSTTRKAMLYKRHSGSTIFLMFVYAFFLSVLLGLLSGNRLKEQANATAKKILLQNDRTGEFALRIALNNIREVDWVNIFNASGSSFEESKIMDSIIQRHFNGYLKKYTTHIYLFDSLGNALCNDNGESMESLNTLHANLADPTDDEGLSYYKVSYDDFGYIYKMPVTDKATKAVTGWLYCLTRCSGVAPTGKPELFGMMQNYSDELPEGYSYAWYKNGVLVNQYRNYIFPAALPGYGARQFREIQTAGSYQLWMDAGAGLTLALVVQRNLGVILMSLVAHLFCFFLLFYGLMRLVEALFNGRLFSLNYWAGFTLTMQARIRATIVFILSTSFVIIASITIYFFISQYKKNNEAFLEKKMQALAPEILRRMPFDFTLKSSGEQVLLMKKILLNATRSIEGDANFYNTSGYLIASTQNFLLEKGLIGTMVEPGAWCGLTNAKMSRYVSREKNGSLDYTSIYQPLYNKAGKLLGYLQVPYFASQTELSREISNFIVILINIIAFVFLISGGLALWISGGFTKSFDLIAQKMNRIRLLEKNERISWPRNDEIGKLVTHYNAMVDQMEESAKKMAKTEREMAWREMARQVAHEIKNPLTPMKLSLQFLQRAIKENDSDLADITHRVAGNLVTQIDHLSKIAHDFSQFANLDIAKREIVNADDVLEGVIQLFASQDNLVIERLNARARYRVAADKTQLNRLFTNLLKNAAEAARPDCPMHISVRTSTSEPGFVLFSLSDNGLGISETAKSKIFMPNFTTKTSGTGLGLAICKAIVENLKGDIWFSTSQTGTTFYIKIPLAG